MIDCVNISKRSEAANQPFLYWIEWNISLSLWVSLSANRTKWSNALKQFVSFCRRIVWVCLTFFFLILLSSYSLYITPLCMFHDNSFILIFLRFWLISRSKMQVLLFVFEKLLNVLKWAQYFWLDWYNYRSRCHWRLQFCLANNFCPFISCSWTGNLIGYFLKCILADLVLWVSYDRNKQNFCIKFC